MNPNNSKQGISAFPNQKTVKQAPLELQSSDSPMHQIPVVTKDSNLIQNLVDPANQQPITRVEGAKAGAILGSVGVGLTTLTLGLGILLIPGVGPAIALDSILTTVLGSSVASTAGGLYGAFLGCLDPEKQLNLYREQFKSGDD
ncbi:hypothetical protein [Pantanalinema sp. GBBB05]|uniref:hypothetical protein n=1 Tax=Pantanalinema sp. GBBB05 TaxID=2604139 RepID=UPI001D9A3433|nr:hypothetical protein [Pantanalinema sp. GBBB05]